MFKVLYIFSQEIKFLNIFAVIPAVFIMLVLDKVVNYEAYSTLYVITSGVVVAYLCNGVLGYLKLYLLDFLSQKVEAKLSIKAFDKLLSLPMQRFNKESDMFAKFTSQISLIKNLLTQRIFSTALDSISLVVFVPILFFYSPVLFSVVLVFSIAGALSSMYFTKKSRDASMEMNKNESKRQEFVSIAVHGIENVKGLALEPSIKDAWRDIEANYIISSEKLQHKNAILQNVTSTINQLMTAMVIFVGVHLVFAGGLSAGILVGFNMLASRVSTPIISLVTLKTEIGKLLNSVKILSSIIDAPSDNTSKGQKPQLFGNTMSENLNMTEVLTIVQDFITSDGMIKSEQRKFYQVLRTVLSTHEGTFSQTEIEQYMIVARTETLDLSDEDYKAIYDVVIERYTLSQRLEEEARLEEERIMREKWLEMYPYYLKDKLDGMVVPIHLNNPIVWKCQYKDFDTSFVECADKLFEQGALLPNPLEVGKSKSTAPISINKPENQPHNLKDNFMKNFLNWINPRVREVMNRWTYHPDLPFYIERSWFNEHNKTGETLEHTHGATPIVVSCYVRKDHQDSGNIMFRDPMFQTRAHEDNLQAHYPWRIIPVEQNDILIFPGWLEHKTEPSKAIGRRICLTLNYNFKPMGVKK